MKKFKIAAYISGSGSNLKSIIENCKNGYLNSEVVLVISSNKDAFGLEMAESYGIKAVSLNSKELGSSEFRKKQLELLEESGADLIVLAGYLKKLSGIIVDKYEGRILNIHPALLPKWGGKGMHGMNVHRAVIEAGEKVSGPTVHFVDKIYDNGEILLQKEVSIDSYDTPESLQKKVLKLEHVVYSEAIKLLEEKE